MLVHKEGHTEVHRPFWASLIMEKDGSLNLGWLFTSLLCLTLIFCSIWAIVVTTSVFVKIAALTSLVGSLATMLLASVPISKAKILATAKLPSELAHSVVESSINAKEEGLSTDIKEALERKELNQINQKG